MLSGRRIFPEKSVAEGAMVNSAVMTLTKLSGAIKPVKRWFQ
jgi:hypothetical protein